MRNSINEDGYYVGSEFQWSIEDVEMTADRMGLDLSEADLKRVLVASFQDNEYLMEVMCECIKTTIDYMVDEGEIKTNMKT